MTTAWLPFLIGLTTGSVLVWFLSTIPSHGRASSTDGWTVAAISSRIAHERSNFRSEAHHTTITRHRRYTSAARLPRMEVARTSSSKR